MAQIYRFDLSFVRECSAECANGVTFDLRLAGQAQGPWSPALGHHQLKGHFFGAVHCRYIHCKRVCAALLSQRSPGPTR